MGKVGRKLYELWSAVYLNNENINIERYQTNTIGYTKDLMFYTFTFNLRK